MSGMTSSPGGEIARRTTVSAFERSISNQPESASAAITTNIEKLRAATAIIAGARRVRLTGIGPDLLVAQAGEHILRSIGINAFSANAFDLALFPSGFEPGDVVVVINHNGASRYAVESLNRAVQSGLKSVVLTSIDSPLQDADVVIGTAVAEQSPVPATSTTSALAALAAIAARIEPDSPLATAVPSLPETIRSMLPSRQTALQVAEMVLGKHRNTMIVGVGGLAPVASLGALLTRMTAHVPVSGMHLEEAIQGGLLGLNPDDLVIHLAPAGPADERHAEFAELAAAIGIHRWKIGGAPDSATWHTQLPRVPEVISPLLCCVPLQWLAVETARLRGTDPDAFRRNDPAFDHAYTRVQL